MPRPGARLDRVTGGSLDLNAQINRSRFDPGGWEGGRRKLSALVREVHAGHLKSVWDDVERELSLFL